MTGEAAGSAPASADPLAEELWAAMENHRTVPEVQPWRAVDVARAATIAGEVYRRAGVAAEDAAVSAWKLGALDDATQQRLGLPGPLVAPVLPGGLRTRVDGVRLLLSDYVQPKLEAELGVRVDGDRLRLAPCIEIADCRFPDWTPPPACAVADFGLQGSMVFGEPVEPPPSISVTVRHDGRPVSTATGWWKDAVARLDILPGGLVDGLYVATGSMTPMLPAAPGRWEFDFGDAGRLVLHFG